MDCTLRFLFITSLLSFSSVVVGMTQQVQDVDQESQARSLAYYAMAAHQSSSKKQSISWLPGPLIALLEESKKKHEELRQVIATHKQEMCGIKYNYLRNPSLKIEIYKAIEESWFNPNYRFDDGGILFLELVDLAMVYEDHERCYSVNLLPLIFKYSQVDEDVIIESIMFLTGKYAPLAQELIPRVQNTKKLEALCIHLAKKGGLNKGFYDLLKNKFSDPFSDLLKKLLTKEELNQLMKEAIIQTEDIKGLVGTSACLVRAGADPCDFEIDGEHPLVIITKKVIAEGPLYDEELLDSYSFFLEVCMSPLFSDEMKDIFDCQELCETSADTVTDIVYELFVYGSQRIRETPTDTVYELFSLLICSHDDRLKINPFHKIIHFLDKALRKKGRRLKDEEGRRLCINEVFRIISTATFGSHLKTKGGQGTFVLVEPIRKRIFALASKLASSSEEYIQVLYDEFMKRKDSEDLFTHIHRSLRDDFDNSFFERKLLGLGAREASTIQEI